MNATLASFLLVLFALSLHGQEEGKPIEATPVYPTPENQHWEKMHAQDQEQIRLQQEYDLVMIGDSITNGWGGKDKQEILSKALPDVSLLNLGISGEVTQGVLWRLHDGLLDEVDAGVIMVTIGTNNIGKRAAGSAEDVALGISEIVRTLRERVPEAKILLLGIFPRGAEEKNGSRQRVYEVNEIVKELHDGESVFYRDLKAVFLNPDDQTANENLSRDKLHLSLSGYEAWIEAVKGDILRLSQQ